MGKEKDGIDLDALYDLEKRLGKSPKTPKFSAGVMQVWLAYTAKGEKAAFENGYDHRASKMVRKFVRWSRGKLDAEQWDRVKHRVTCRLADFLKENARKP